MKKFFQPYPTRGPNVIGIKVNPLRHFIKRSTSKFLEAPYIIYFYIYLIAWETLKYLSG